jgi:CRP-like cAMP-binding protein
LDFSDAAWKETLSNTIFRFWDVNETIFSAGEYPRKAYFLVQGRGRYFYVDKEGKEKVKSIVRVGGVYASMSTLVNGEPSPFYAQSMVKSITAEIDYKDVLALCEKYWEWSILLRRLLEQLTLKKEKREAAFLMLSAQERYEQFLDEYGREASEIPLKQVASYIGVTDVALSRIRKKMSLT